jgi:hypothetical protein
VWKELVVEIIKIIFSKNLLERTEEYRDKHEPG